MRILVIGYWRAYESRRLEEAALALGHTVTTVDIKEITFDFWHSSAPIIRSIHRHTDTKGKPTHAESITHTISPGVFDVVYFRNTPHTITDAIVLAEWCLSMGMRVVSSGIGSQSSIRSKLYESLKLHHAGIPTPRTIRLMHHEDIAEYLEAAQFPLVVKRLHGSCGAHVFLTQDPAAAWDIVTESRTEHSSQDDIPYLFQEYLPFAEEYRVLTLGGTAIGAMRRHDIAGDFRRNASLGSVCTKAELSPELIALCERAAVALGRDLGGVDLAITDTGEPYIIEVNKHPQFQRFESATGIDVASHVIRYLTDTQAPSHHTKTP